MIKDLLSKTFAGLKECANVIIDFNSHMVTIYKTSNPITPLFGESFHSKKLLERRLFDYFIFFFKIDFQHHSIFILLMQFIDDIVQYDYTFKYVATGHECYLVCGNFIS